MIPLRLLVDFLAYDGTPPTNNPVDETRAHRKVEELNITQLVRAKQQIPASTSNVTVPLAATTNDYLVIYTDQQVTAFLNGSETPLTLTPQLAGTKCPVFVMRGTITSLVITNALAVPANIDVSSVKI